MREFRWSQTLPRNGARAEFRLRLCKARVGVSDPHPNELEPGALLSRRARCYLAVRKRKEAGGRVPAGLEGHELGRSPGPGGHCWASHFPTGATDCRHRPKFVITARLARRRWAVMKFRHARSAESVIHRRLAARALARHVSLGPIARGRTSPRPSPPGRCLPSRLREQAEVGRISPEGAGELS